MVKTNFRLTFHRVPYQAALDLGQYPTRFPELKGKTGADIASLPFGAIVVWGKSDKLPLGDITMTLGNGEELCSTAHLR